MRIVFLTALKFTAMFCMKRAILYWWYRNKLLFGEWRSVHTSYLCAVPMFGSMIFSPTIRGLEKPLET